MKTGGLFIGKVWSRTWWNGREDDPEFQSIPGPPIIY